jgi:hypothetical protein
MKSVNETWRNEKDEIYRKCEINGEYKKTYKKNKKRNEKKVGEIHN